MDRSGLDKSGLARSGFVKSARDRNKGAAAVAVADSGGGMAAGGAPGGVGLAMQPPRWLKAGDRVRVEIDRIGAIEAEMRSETAALDSY